MEIIACNICPFDQDSCTECPNVEVADEIWNTILRRHREFVRWKRSLDEIQT